MKKIIAFCSMLLALCAGATNITNYPVRTTFSSAYWFLLSDVAMQTNWNLPGNYVASTTDLNNASNTIVNLITNTIRYTTNFDNITVTNGIRDLNLTPSSLMQTDPLDNIISLLNGTGLLTNSGAGAFGWLPIADLTNFSSIVVSNSLIVQSNAYFFATNFFGSITVTNPITNLSLTANTIIKADANKALASVANGTGALTNNNSGVFGWFTYASLQDITNTVNSYTNTFMAATNMTFTNGTLLVKQIAYLTNTGTMAPDFAHGYDAITTNASFTFLNPINTDASGKFAETTVKLVENSSGSPIVATPFANCIVISNSYMGVGANGATWFTFVRYGTQRTNVYANAETR